MAFQNFARGVAHVLVVTTVLIASTSSYEISSGYQPRSGRSYRYAYPQGSNTWRYSRQGIATNYPNGGYNDQTRYYDPNPSDGIAGGTGVVKNRRRNYADSAPSLQQFNSQMYNEVDTSMPTGNRWYSSVKRMAPTSTASLDQHNRVQMGVSNSLCDDAKSNLTLDWDLSPINYTCFHPETRFPRAFDTEPIMECETLPPRYVPGHVCMGHSIPYKDSVPTHGDHRPLWPKFGEYVFVPRERWLHNIEHGAIVMLYHPCAYSSEVNRLKTIVRGCVGKHVITPSTLLTPERPLALVAWGCRLLLSSVEDEIVMKFIESRAHRGPEGTYTKEGQYELGLRESGKSTGNGAKYGYSKVSCDTIDRTKL